MRLSNIFIFCLALATSMVQADFLTEIASIVQACQQEFPCTREELKNSFKKDTDSTRVSDNVKCYNACLMLKDGSLINGALDVQRLAEGLKKIPALKDYLPEALKALEICKLERGLNDCELAFKFNKCMSNNISVHFLDM